MYVARVPFPNLHLSLVALGEPAPTHVGTMVKNPKSKNLKIPKFI
jgi:hypothetical protein